MPFDLSRGFGDAREPIEIRVLDAPARAWTPCPLSRQLCRIPPEHVDRAVGWAVANRLATRTLLPSGEHIALTESGIANVGLQRRLSSMLGPDGQIDVARVGGAPSWR